jgi:hypothetical protein
MKCKTLQQFLISYNLEFKIHGSVGLDDCVMFCVSGRGGVRVCYYWMCALRIDTAKMRPVDAMFIPVFLGKDYIFRMLCTKRSGRVSMLLDVWSFGKISVLSGIQIYPLRACVFLCITLRLTLSPS